MNYSRKYSRNFIPLKQDNPKYNLDFRPSLGRCLVEIKDGKGKLTIYAQGIKPKIDYSIELLGFSKGELKNAYLGSFSVDEYGKGEFKKDFDPDNVLDSGKNIESYNIVALTVDDDSSSALVGYVGNEVSWKEAYKNIRANSHNNKKDCIPCKPKPIPTPDNNTKPTPTPTPDNNTKPIPTPDNNTKPIPIPEPDNVAKDIEDGLIEKEKGLIDREKGLIDREESIVQKEQFGNMLSLPEFEISLLDKEKGLIDKERGLIDKEEGLLDKKTAIEKGILPIDDDKLRAKEKELIKMEEELIEKEEKLVRREKHTIRKNPTSDKELGLIEKEKGLIEKELGLIEKEKGLISTEKGLIDIEDALLEKREAKDSDIAPKDDVNAKGIYDKSSTINNDINYIKEYNAKMTPFKDDNDICWYRISPYELMCLPKEYYKYYNNPFVYACYRKYKHLMLGVRCMDNEESYILAVPCKYDANFKATGELAYFDEFVPINKDEKGDNIYGYRLMYIL